MILFKEMKDKKNTVTTRIICRSIMDRICIIARWDFAVAKFKSK